MTDIERKMLPKVQPRKLRESRSAKKPSRVPEGFPARALGADGAIR